MKIDPNMDVIDEGGEGDNENEEESVILGKTVGGHVEEPKEEAEEVVAPKQIEIKEKEESPADGEKKD